jgi:hypothetical protein
LAKLQTLPHEPQLDTLLLRLISQPLAACASQLPNPALHAPSLQAPAAQVADALAKLQSLPHEPQLFGSLASCTSQPLSVCLSQSTHPEAHSVMLHTPARQLVVAFGTAQVQPHWLAAPPPPQVSGGAQEPQLISPQPVSTIPHEAPRCAQVFGVHPHWFATPAPPH